MRPEDYQIGIYFTDTEDGQVTVSFESTTMEETPATRYGAMVRMALDTSAMETLLGTIADVLIQTNEIENYSVEKNKKLN